MTERSIFISSCSRRQLARRRPAGIVTRGRRIGVGAALAGEVVGIPLVLLALIALAALAAGMLVAGGL
jgi:hypothetical protein